MFSLVATGRSSDVPPGCTGSYQTASSASRRPRRRRPGEDRARFTHRSEYSAHVGACLLHDLRQNVQGGEACGPVALDTRFPLVCKSVPHRGCPGESVGVWARRSCSPGHRWATSPGHSGKEHAQPVRARVPPSVRRVSWREVHARLCVQRRLACSAGDRPVGVKARSPVARIAGWRETEILKPIDKII